jgi:hypothetical protein
MAGAIDLFSGSRPLTGYNGFKVDKDPLQQLDGGLASAIGGVATNAGQGFTDIIQALIDTLTGITGATLIQVAEWVSNLAAGVTLVIEDVIQLIKDLLCSIDLSHGPENFFASITTLVQTLGGDFESLTTDLISLGLAIFGLDFSTVENFFQSFVDNIIGLLGDLGTNVIELIASIFGAPFDFFANQAQQISDMAEWVLDTIFGLVPPDRIPILPIGHLIYDPVNLLSNPSFTQDGIEPGQEGEWVLDTAVSHDNLGGSARIDANGKNHTLLSTDLIPVHGISVIPLNAQQLGLSAWVKTDKLVGPRGSVRMGLATYKTSNATDTPVYVDLFDLFGAPIPNQFGTTDWKHWSSDWVVEPGVKSVRYHVTVSDQATSGSVWFDNLFLGKNGLLQVNAVEGLQQLFFDFGSLVTHIATQAWTTLVDVEQAIEKAIADLIKLIIGPGNFANLEAFIAHVTDFLNPEHIFQSIQEAISGLIGGATAGLASIQHVADEIGAALAGFVTTIFGGFTFNNFEEFIKHVLDSIKPEAIFASIQQSIQGLLTGFASIQHVAEQIAAQAWTTLTDVEREIEKAIKDLIASIIGPGNFANLEAFLNSLKPENIFNSIQQSIQGLLTGLASIQHVADEIAAALVNFVTTIFGGVPNINNFQEFIQHVLDSLKPQAIWDSLKVIPQILLDIFTHVANEIKKLTGGIVINLGPIEFLNSLIAVMTGHTDPDTGKPVQIPDINVAGPGGFPNIGAGVMNAITNLEATWVQWLTALTGRPQTTDTATSQLTADQLAALMATQAANSAAIAQLQQETAVTGGMTGGDGFERTTPTTISAVGNEWNETGSVGYFGIKDGHQAEWVNTTAAAHDSIFLRTATKDAATKTTYQSITRTTGSKVAQFALVGHATDKLFGRMNAAKTQYVEAGAYNFSAGLGTGSKAYIAIKNGATTLKIQEYDPVGGGPGFGPSAGCTYTLECGTPASPHIYRLLRNGVAIGILDDSVAKVSAILDNNRGWGFGGSSGLNALNGLLVPSSVQAVAVADNVPDPVVGTYLRAWRMETGGIQKPTGDKPLPDGTIDEYDVISSDLAYSKTTGEIIISKPGPYIVNCRLQMKDLIYGEDRWELLIYKNNYTTPFMRGSEVAGTNGIGTTPEFHSVAGAFQVYCKAGDRLKIGLSNIKNGVFNVNPIEIVGDAQGTETWLTVTRGS